MYPYTLMLGIKKQSLKNVASFPIGLVGFPLLLFDMPQNATFGCTFLFEHTISCHILPLAMAFSFISLTTKEEEEEEEGIIIITRQSSSHYVVVKNSCEIKQRR